VLPPEERQALWDALLGLRAAGAGVVLTTRDTAFGDGRLVQGHQTDVLALRGLLPSDAYTLATTILDDLKVGRDRAPVGELRQLLIKLDHHPLAMSLTLLALRDQTLTLSDINRDYAALLMGFKDDTTTGRNASLLASLEYSLRRLSPEQREWLLRLAPFEGGASEDDLLKITEIPEAAWSELRPALEHAALIIPERVANYQAPFLRFHPILVPYLRTLSNAQPAELLARFAARYYVLSRYFYQEDSKNPQAVRPLVLRELPNLRRGLDLLIEQGENEAAVDMADSLNQFYINFDMSRERVALIAQIGEVNIVSDGTLSYAEYMRQSSAGESEFFTGNIRAAYNRFNSLLSSILTNPPDAKVSRGSYGHCITLQRLARCLSDGGQPGVAESSLREALGIIDALIVTDPKNITNMRERSALLTELGDVLQNQGKFVAARQMYEQSLEIDKQTGDERGQGVLLVQLGTLALRLRNPVEADRHYNEALNIFQRLGETSSMATIYHQLGMIAQEQRNWPAADEKYRKALALREQHQLRIDAAATCNQLAIVARLWGKPAEAEQWYRRALGYSGNASKPHTSTMLNNLASLIKDEIRAGRQPHHRLAEAQQLAEQALAIKETLDASGELWTTLSILATIAEMENRSDDVQTYRRRARESFAAFEGNRWHIDQQHGNLVNAIANAALGNQQAREAVESALPSIEKNGWMIAESTGRIWAGERDWHSLCEGLDNQDSLLVLRILETLEQPTSPTPTPEQNQEGATPEDIRTVIAALPEDVRVALEQRDVQAFNTALARLPDSEREQVIGLLEQAGIIDRQEDTPQQLLAALPEAVRAAVQQGDMAALQVAMDALPEDERQAAMQVLQRLNELAKQQATPEQLIAALPADFRAAVEQQDLEAMQRIFDGLPEAEQARVAAILQQLQAMQGE
jgi:tetratricopeptide (TPR) repeat protein